MSSRRRTSALLLTAALVISGCSVLPSTKSKIYTQKPAIGQCWQATNKQASDWMDWQGFAPVNCTEKHTLETVGVSDVEGDFPGTGLGGADEYSEEFKVAASQSCNESWDRASADRPKPNRLLNFLFYPSPEEFATGARWVRCDLGAYDIGTAWNQNEFQLQILTRTFAAVTPDSAFDLCLDSSSDEIGNGDALKVADCEKPHRWTMVRASDLGVSADEEYPGADEVNSRARISCNFKKPKAITGWFWQTPTESQWTSGTRTSYCWWANAQTQTSQALAKSLTPLG